MAFDAQQTRRAQAIVLVAAAVIVVAIAAVVFSGALTPGASNGTADSTSQAADGATDGSSQAAGQAVTSGEHDMTHVDANYASVVEQLQAQYDSDPSNPSALLQLANGYFDWGVAAREVVATDEDDAHVVDLFNQAIARYDDYLEQNPDSKSVEVDRAISIFYAGDRDRAIAELESFTAEDGSFGPAWANLGMFYETEGRTDEAIAAYERAIESDSSDAYGVKDYAQQHLDALSAS